MFDPSAYAGNAGFDVNPNFQPLAGSPAYAGNPGHGLAVAVADPWFTPTCYVGAVGPRVDDRWWEGWTYFDQDGDPASRVAAGQPIDLTKPLVIIDNHRFYQPNRTFGPDSNYLIRGNVRVKSQAKLTILPGTVLFEERSTSGTIVIERGARIDAQGTPTSPIVFTSDDYPNPQIPGGGGGLFINGYAKGNIPGLCSTQPDGTPNDSLQSEGGNGGVWGGPNDADNSGTLRYIRIEFAGIAVSPNNESNTFTFNGVGSGTTIDHLQGHRGLDDNFEFFGGDVRVRYLVSTDNDDDGYDWQLGARGKGQFLIVRHSAVQAGADKAIEADHDGTGNPAGTRRDSVSCSGRGGHQVANFTFIGDRRSGPGFGGGPTLGIHLREGTAGDIRNGIVVDYKTNALRIQHDPTFVAHCNAIPANPAVFCSAGSVSVPTIEGQLFVTHGAPNPFHDRVAIRFALAQSAHVRVEVFAANGRLVQVVADREMPAGNHALTWDADRSVPTGMYFYRVTTPAGASTGKITRVD